MNASKRCDLSAGLEGVQRRFERWRQTRRGHSRIPDELWAAAVKAAGVHGLHRTVRALRLDYYSLKERVEQQAGTPCTPAASAAGRRRPSARKRPGRRRADTAQSLPAFLELTPPAAHGFLLAPAGPCQSIVEWQDGAGAKMRVELKGTASAKTLAAHQLHVLLSAGNPEAVQAAPACRSGRRIDSEECSAAAPIAPNRSYVFHSGVPCYFRAKRTSSFGHGGRRMLLRFRCPPRRDDCRWLGQRLFGSIVATTD
jgi:hypothetical protein